MLTPRIASATNPSSEWASGTYPPGQSGPRDVVRVYAGGALLTATIAIGQSILGKKKGSLGERLIGGAGRLAMVDQDQVVDRKAHASRLIDQAVPDIGREVWLARQDPEIGL